MKRFIALLILIPLVAAGCSAKREGLPARVDREAVLPAELVRDLAGASMRLVYDRRDDALGYLCWAWEETGGETRLLYMEAWLPPADAGARYEEACKGAEELPAPKGASACYDGRSAHLLVGGCYIRLATLGFPDERGAFEQLFDRLSEGLAP